MCLYPKTNFLSQKWSNLDNLERFLLGFIGDLTKLLKWHWKCDRIIFASVFGNSTIDLTITHSVGKHLESIWHDATTTTDFSLCEASLRRFASNILFRVHKRKRWGMKFAFLQGIDISPDVKWHLKHFRKLPFIKIPSQFYGESNRCNFFASTKKESPAVLLGILVTWFPRDFAQGAFTWIES